MGQQGATAEHPGAGPRAPARAGRHLPILVIVRLVLVLGWVAIVLNSFSQAREASVGELQRDLADGSVTSIQVVRADPGAGAQGRFPIRWDAGLVDSFALYEYDPSAGVDEVAELLAQARADGLPVHVVPADQMEETVTREGWLATAFGASVGLAGLLIIALSVITLITSPRPWLATRWAWFWLVWAIPVLWLVFLALEPRPIRLSLRLAVARRHPLPLPGAPERRLTGGWAFVIAWIASAVLAPVGLSVLSGWH